MEIIQRAKGILLKPRETWPTIAVEPGDIGAVYRRYLVVLAAVPAVATFIGMSIMGMRMPVVAALSSAVLGYAITLGMVFVMALIVDALAPSFGGSRDRVRAFKLVAYGSTAALLGGVFAVLPALAVLGLVAAAYSVYLFYLGLPVLMRCPQDKAVGYTAAVAVIGIVANVLAGAVIGSTVGGRGWMI